MLLRRDAAAQYEKPRQDLSNKNLKKTGYLSWADWYAQNARYAMTLWNNRRLYPMPYKTNNQPTPVDEINENFNYYYGTQTNKPLVPEGDDVDFAQWMNGQKIPQIVMFMCGQMSNLLQSAEWTIKSFDKKDLTKRQMLLNLSLVKEKFAEFFNNVEGMGIGLSPLVDEASEVQQGVDPQKMLQMVEYNPITMGEKIAMKIVAQMQRDTRYSEVYNKAFRECIIGRYCGIHNFIKNGRLVREVIRPQNLIINFRTDSDRNRRAPEIGFIEFLTCEEIFAKFSLNQEERDQIYNLAYTSNPDVMWNPWNTTYNNTPYMWWMQRANDNKRLVACVTTYWSSFVQPDYSEVDFDEVFIHKATLIGNKVLTEYGVDDNIVRNPHNYSEIEYPIQVYIPDLENGMNRSVVDRLRPLQDRIDAIEYTLVKKYARDKGKVYLIKGHKAYNIDVSDMMRDFSMLGYHVATHTGEMDDYTNTERIVETMDFTVDPNLGVYIQLKEAYRREMEQIFNISQIALGQQTTYVGAATQSTSIQQSSTGQSNLFQGFINYVIDVEQYGLDKIKLAAMTTKGMEYLKSFLTENELQYVKNTKRFTMSDLRAFLKIEDVIDSSMRQRLLMYAQAWSQNPDLVPPQAVIAMETARTLSELKNEMTKVLSISEIKQQQAQAAMMQQQMAQQALQDGNEDARLQSQQETDLQKQQMKSEADMAKQVLGMLNQEGQRANATRTQ